MNSYKFAGSQHLLPQFVDGFRRNTIRFNRCLDICHYAWYKTSSTNCTTASMLYHIVFIKKIQPLSVNHLSSPFRARAEHPKKFYYTFTTNLIKPLFVNSLLFSLPQIKNKQ